MNAEAPEEQDTRRSAVAADDHGSDQHLREQASDESQELSREEADEEADESDALPAISFDAVRDNEELSQFIAAADRVMKGLGYTEHGFRHANLTGRIAYNLMHRLGFDEHTCNLAHVSAYLHDVGNMVAREMHGQTGGLLVYNVLRREVPPEDLATIVSAVANHEEADGHAVGPVASAVILADKSDVHRSRVRKRAELEFDIHDRVNYAAEQSFLRVDSDARTVTLELTIDTEISHVMEYFEIFLGRMVMCRRAAEMLDCRFRLTINGAQLL
ncbi:MAG TPA: phosphohydrolase [Actinomycetota bacterium]|nr:phosphohydrolase [Actinomycetota bacterium]